MSVAEPVPAQEDRRPRGLARPGMSAVLLFLCMALALATRCFLLDRQVLSGDESFSWRLTRYSAADLVRRTAADVHPPLYYLLLKAWLAAWGTSPGALRGFSVVLGVLCVPVLYAVCLEACTARIVQGKLTLTTARSGSLFSAGLLAVHLAQVTPGRTGRMYSLGVLLAGLTSWLLLRALRAEKRELWWMAYGVAVAAFCYTHYYAFFTVLAQTLFVVGDLLVRGGRHGWRQALPSLVGFACAGALALLLYLPWLPVLWRQIHEVRQSYWIPPVTWKAAGQVFFSWGLGLDYQGTWELRLWLLLLAGCVLWVLAHGDRGGWFFLFQAAMPWLLSLGISLHSGRPIFVERYLAFAQFSLLAFWSAVWCRLPGATERALLATFLSTTALYGLWTEAARWPREWPALARAADFLKDHYHAADVIRVDGGAPSVNRLRFYLAEAGVTDIAVRCRVDLSAHDGHVTHVASLDADDVLGEEREEEIRFRGRLWLVSEGSEAAQGDRPGMRFVLTERFEGGGGTHCALALYERKE